MNYAIGVDIGGTHVTAGIVDLDNDLLIRESLVRNHIDPSGQAEEIIESWKSIILQSAGACNKDVSKIGIAMPGPFDYEQGISLIKGLHKYESLYGLNAKEMLSKALGISSENIRLINDASAFLLGEMHCGAAKGYSNLVCITLGTGLGSAAYYDGQLEEGDLYNTDFLDAKAEDYLSSRWIYGEYNRLTGSQFKGAKEIAERLKDDADAVQTFQLFGINFGNVLVQRYGHQNPDVIVIGGNISKAWDAFIPYSLEIIHQSGHDFKLKPAELGEEAALIGGSYLF